MYSEKQKALMYNVLFETMCAMQFVHFSTHRMRLILKPYYERSDVFGNDPDGSFELCIETDNGSFSDFPVVQVFGPSEDGQTFKAVYYDFIANDINSAQVEETDIGEYTMRLDFIVYNLNLI